MKKTCFVMTLLISMLCIFFFAGCAPSDGVKSISVEGNDEAFVIELGKFSYEDYKIKVNYSNGKTEEIALSEDMVASYDKLKFYKEGEQTVKITYKNCSCEMKINVQRASLESVVTFESKQFVYDGNIFELNVQGLPADAKVYYPNGNSASKVGTHKIEAICYGDNYKTLSKTANLIITEAEYDMSNVKFEDAEYTYDGDPKSISITGTLPDGVKVSYSIDGKDGNSATDAKEYTVIASFSSNNNNYKPIANMTATLNIKKAKYKNLDITLSDKNVVYDGHTFFIEAEGKDLSSLPKGVELKYSIQKIKNARGESVVSAIEVDKRSAIYAGTYKVTLSFVIPDANNYESIESKTATLFIDRAEGEINNAFMYSKMSVYDKTEKTIELKGTDPNADPVLPIYAGEITYKIKMIRNALGKDVQAEAVDGNGAIDAGTYEVSAHIALTNENYYEIPEITGLLEIQQAEYEDFTVIMDELQVSYDGESHSIIANCKNTPETVTIIYKIMKVKDASGNDIENPTEEEGNSAIDAGTYTIRAIFDNSDPNYIEISPITATLVITEVTK